MSHGTSGTKIHEWQNFIASSASPAFAALFTNPLEVAKVRKQMDGELKSKNSGAYRGTVNTLLVIYRNEGIKGAQAGLPVAVLREASKNFFRIGAFEPILSRIHTTNDPAPMYKRLIAGAFSGFTGALICNPIELIKTRLQAESSPELAKLVGRKQFGYTGIGNAFSTMLREEGVSGMWKGSVVSMWRSALWTAVHMTSYTMFKEVGIKYKFSNNSFLHAWCSFWAAFAAVCVANPLDVVRSRLFNQAGGKIYDSAWDCTMKITRTEGPLGFYKGFWQHFMRSGPHFIITFVVMEQIKQFFVSSNQRKGSV